MMITFLNKLEWSLLKNDTGEHLSFFMGRIFYSSGLTRGPTDDAGAVSVRPNLCSPEFFVKY